MKFNCIPCVSANLPDIIEINKYGKFVVVIGYCIYIFVAPFAFIAAGYLTMFPWGLVMLDVVGNPDYYGIATIVAFVLSGLFASCGPILIARELTSSQSRYKCELCEEPRKPDFAGHSEECITLANADNDSGFTNEEDAGQTDLTSNMLFSVKDKILYGYKKTTVAIGRILCLILTRVQEKADQVWRQILNGFIKQAPSDDEKKSRMTVTFLVISTSIGMLSGLIMLILGVPFSFSELMVCLLITFTLFGPLSFLASIIMVVLFKFLVHCFTIQNVQTYTQEYNQAKQQVRKTYDEGMAPIQSANIIKTTNYLTKKRCPTCKEKISINTVKCKRCELNLNRLTESEGNMGIADIISCHKCNEPNKFDAVLCLKCGVDLKKYQESREMNKKCPYCKEEILIDSIKCRWCESELVETSL